MRCIQCNCPAQPGELWCDEHDPGAPPVDLRALERQATATCALPPGEARELGEGLTVAVRSLRRFRLVARRLSRAFENYDGRSCELFDELDHVLATLAHEPAPGEAVPERGWRDIILHATFLATALSASVAERALGELAVADEPDPPCLGGCAPGRPCFPCQAKARLAAAYGRAARAEAELEELRRQHLEAETRAVCAEIYAKLTNEELARVRQPLEEGPTP